MKTTLAKSTDTKRQWYEFDASKLSLGRLSAVIARILSGKHKPSYTPHVDGGDFVVVTNIENVLVTGRKLLQKEYFHYSGYPGGLKRRAMKDVLKQHPEKIIYSAVYGMLAHNRQRSERMKRLKLVKGETHSFKIDKKLTSNK